MNALTKILQKQNSIQGSTKINLAKRQCLKNSLSQCLRNKPKALQGTDRKSQHRQQDLPVHGIAFYHSYQAPLSARHPLYKVLSWDLGSQRPAEGSDYPGLSQTATKTSLFPKICPSGDTCYQAVLRSFKQYRKPRVQTLLAGIASGCFILFTFLHSGRTSLPTSGWLLGSNAQKQSKGTALIWLLGRNEHIQVFIQGRTCNVCNKSQLSCTGLTFFQVDTQPKRILSFCSEHSSEEEAVLLKTEGEIDWENETLSTAGNNNIVLVCPYKENMILQKNSFIIFFY